MIRMTYLATTICLLVISAMVASVTTLEPMYISTFSMAGASGNVTFTPGLGANCTISVLMVLPAGTYNWAIHDRPTLYDQRPACGKVFTGGVFASGGDLSTAHGKLTVTDSGDLMADFTNDLLQLTGVDSIAGRSLVLQADASSTLICANILDYNSDVVTAVARFLSPFAGTVTFRQRQDSPSADTTILVDLYSVVSPLDATTYRWEIHSSIAYDKTMNLKERCSNTESSVFNPTGMEASACQPNDHSTCPIGSLSSKFSDITVEPTETRTTRYYIDTNLLLNTNPNSVLGKNLVFTSSDGTYIACSPIQVLLPKIVSAEISVAGVSGAVEFTQRSPYDATYISVSLSNLQGLAGGYHVHDNPTKSRINTADLPASNDNAGGHFNPFGVVAGDSPEAGTGTNDQYEVGDISGKFGKLTGLNNYSAQHVDWNMQLYGRYSIVGRSILIHKTVANERWAYGNIGYPTEVKTVKAVFNSIVAGKIVFRQDPNDPYSDTSVYMEVVHTDGMDTSNNHKFHVHMKPITNDDHSEDGRCASTAEHYNPFVDAKTSYDYCNFSNPFRCEVGDLSRKFKTVDIPSAMTGSSSQYFYTDSLLPLSGIYSVRNRSLVIHTSDSGAPRYACANLYDVPSVSIATDTWTDGGQGKGIMSFSQASEFDRTMISVEMVGLNQRAGGWHIHALPVDKSNADGPCSGASVKGHYNPFEVVGSPATGTHDMYEVGDLSGKFGSFVGDMSVSEVYMDTNLALSGPRSVAGRSLVIHKDDTDGSRWVCTDVEYTLTANDFTIVARAAFQDDKINGVITLKQTRFASGYVGDTRVEVALSADEDIEYEIEILEGVMCDGDNIFNPYEIIANADQCSISRMELCSVGDLSSKHGSVTTNQRALYTDTNLPMFGLNSVIGRNLAARITASNEDKKCSLITPESSSGKKMTHVFPATTEFDMYEFQTTLAREIASGNEWQVVTSEEPQMSTEFEGCSSVEFWVIGPNIEDLVTAYSAAVEAGSMDSYNPTKLCSKGSGDGRQTAPSGFIILLSAILGVFVIASPHRE